MTNAQRRELIFSIEMDYLSLMGEEICLLWLESRSIEELQQSSKNLKRALAKVEEFERKLEAEAEEEARLKEEEARLKQEEVRMRAEDARWDDIYQMLGC